MDKPTVGGHTMCMFKNVTGMPCPGCGMGRATMALANLDLATSLYYNFLCIPFTIAMAVVFIWMVVDLVRRKETIFPYLTRPAGLYLNVILVILLGVDWVLNIVHHI